MIRVVAVVILTILGFAAPARACGANAGSTFCADGWVAQPMERAQEQIPAPDQADGWSVDGNGLDPSFAGGEGVYVEGAVVIDDPISADDGEL